VQEDCVKYCSNLASNDVKKYARNRVCDELERSVMEVVVADREILSYAIMRGTEHSVLVESGMRSLCSHALSQAV
jgi:hypothetical protein